MQLFFSAHIEENTVFLDADETRHCKVLRKTEGDQVQVLDGKGLLIDCRIHSIRKDSAELEIIARNRYPRQRPYYFHLYIAPTKQNERMEWMFEKAIEVGLDEITFIETEHSEKARVNTGRLERIAVSALKQSGQYYLPKINPICKLGQVEAKGMLLAHCGPGEKKSLRELCYPLADNALIRIMIGPEGDFSPSEIERMIRQGAQPVHLGSSRLRTETAGLYCAVMLSGLV